MTKSFNTVVLQALCAFAWLGVGMSVHAQSAAQDKLNALFGGEIIAEGDGFTISRSALDESIVTIRASAAGRRSGALSKAATAQLEREVTRRLINIELLKQIATEEDRATAVERAEERIQLLTERAGSEQAMARQLNAVGLSVDRLRAKLIEEATAEVVLERELDIEITDAQVKEYYDDNPDRFERPERVRAAHILLRTRDPLTRRELSEEYKADQLRKMESLQERARKGEDFMKLVKEYSQDPTTPAEGEFEVTRGQMFPTWEAAAFSLSAGQVSDVITTPVGYHIIKVFERIPASKVELNQEVADEVRAFLKGRELQERMQPYMEKLYEKANVEILVERLKPQEGDNPAPDLQEAEPDRP